MLRSVSLIICFLIIGFKAHSDGYESMLKLDSFETLSKKACNENKVMVVMVGLEGCPYCAKLKKQVLIPELKNGELNNKWLLRELLIDNEATHIGFDGKSINSLAFAQSIKATVTPTLLFLSPNGVEIGKRIIGTGGALDFYDFYLKRSINEALDKQICTNNLTEK